MLHGIKRYFEDALHRFRPPARKYVGHTYAIGGSGKVTFGKVLGEGGYGVVMRATITAPEEAKAYEVAIKIARQDTDPPPRDADLFRNKPPLRHCCQPQWGIVSDGSGWQTLATVMPACEGSLKERIEGLRRDGRMATASQAADWVAQAAICLRDSGLIHRDIKPANLLMSGGAILVGDWGQAVEKGTAVQPGTGTYSHMAPETPRTRQPSEQEDVYALGLVAYEATTAFPGRSFPNPHDPLDCQERVVHDHEERRTGHRQLDRVIREATRRKRSRRSDMLDLLTDLAAWESARRRFNAADREAIVGRLEERLKRREADAKAFRRPVALDLRPAMGLLAEEKDPALKRRLEAVVGTLTVQRRQAVERHRQTLVSACLHEAMTRADPDGAPPRPSLPRLAQELARPPPSKPPIKNPQLTLAAEGGKAVIRDQAGRSWPVEDLIRDPQAQRHLAQVSGAVARTNRTTQSLGQRR